MRSRLTWALAGLLSSRLAWADPSPIVSFDVQHYGVHGQSMEEIRASMFGNSPVRTGEESFGGVTKSQIWATYDLLNEVGGGCSLRNPSVRVEIRMTLPQLDSGQRSPAVQEEWERFMGALRSHELMHAQNGNFIAKTVLSRMVGFKTQLSCAETRPKLNDAIQTLIQRMNDYDKKLDEVTNHGATQGAQLNLRVQ
jgi:predicted secreted Zn-dependent protease